MSKIIHCFPRFRRFGGAQKVILTLHNLLGDKYTSYVSSFQRYFDTIDSFQDVVPDTKYIRMSVLNLLKFRNAIVFSHDRKVTLFLLFFSKIFHFQLIHVAHSVFTDKKLFTFFPYRIIAVSEAVKHNLVNFFEIKEERISVIYNGVEDAVGKLSIKEYSDSGVLNILFLAQIEPVKQQLEVLKHLKGKLKPTVKIDFAGSGGQAAELQKVIENYDLHNQFRYLGFISDVNALITDYHYVLLFSKKEGLGLSLIESCMNSRPIITRGAGGCEACAEVCINNFNGFIVNSLDDLESLLNSLDQIPFPNYKELCFNSRQVFENKFSLQRMVKEYESVIQKLIL